MLKRFGWAFWAVLLVCMALPALGEEAEFAISAEDQLTVGLGETVRLPYQRPWDMNAYFRMSCSDPDALVPAKDMEQSAYPVLTGCFHATFTKKGTYSLRFERVDDVTLQADLVRTIQVTVDDLTTAAHVSRERYVLRKGESAALELTPENGVMYNPPVFQKEAYYQNCVLISEDGSTLTGSSTGHLEVAVKNPLGQELCRFEVVVVDESSQIELTADHEYTAVNTSITFTAKSGGEPVAVLMEITEGSEFAQWDQESRYWSLLGIAPGWVTVTAYGTDGSSASRRVRILSGPDDFIATVSRTTLPAGESAEITVEYPADARLTITGDQPAEEGLEGTVAILQGNRLTGVTEGTCNLCVIGNGIWKLIPITVTHSPSALTVVRPIGYMNVEESFRLCVRDAQGREYPAVFSQDGSNFIIGEDGLITPKRVCSTHLTASLDNGVSYSFEVRAAQYPAWLSCEKEEIVLALNQQGASLSSLGAYFTSDLGSVNMSDVVACSDDPSIVRTELEGTGLYPQRPGSTYLTVWSRYCDVSVRVPVRITEAMDILYIGGHQDTSSLYIPANGQAQLPTVTDYAGNPVSVTWAIVSGDRSAFRIISGKTVSASSTASSCEVRATSRTGATIRVYVNSYYRPLTASLQPSQSVIRTGQRQQISLNWDVGANGSILREGDVTYTLTGDTACVQVEPGFAYYTLTGLAPGTVTLTARLYNGKTFASTVQVVLPEACADGHDPVWQTDRRPSAVSCGTEALCCSRCGVYLGQSRPIPATGIISFRQTDFYLRPGQETQLLTRLNGSRHYSFAWESSDPSVASVSADRVTAIAPGVTDITAAVYDCVPVRCRIHVVEAEGKMLLELPAQLTAVGDGAFEGSGVVTVGLPENAVSIGSRAFADCKLLQLIRIPRSVTQIAPDAFDGSGQVVFLCDENSAAADYAREHGISVLP